MYVTLRQVLLNQLVLSIHNLHYSASIFAADWVFTKENKKKGDGMKQSLLQHYSGPRQSHEVRILNEIQKQQ